MEVRETLWKSCLSTPTKPPAKNCNISLSETAYQHKETRKKCKKTNQAAIIQWQRQCLMDKPHRKPWPKSKISLSRVPVHCITPFCSDALVSPPNLYPPCLRQLPHSLDPPRRPKAIAALDTRMQLPWLYVRVGHVETTQECTFGSLGRVNAWDWVGVCRIAPWDCFGTLRHFYSPLAHLSLIFNL